MESTTQKILRVLGIVVTAILIPVSILALIALQGTGGEHQIVLFLYIAWALVNFIAIPFILLGFIIKYKIKAVLYFAVAHFTLSLANMALLLTSAVNGNALLLAFVTLPSLLYIGSVIINVQNKKIQMDGETA